MVGTPAWAPAPRWVEEASVGQDDCIDINTIAGELYGLPPSEFTSRRDERAAEARRSGDKAVAAEIKKMRRPSVGAWLANLLAHERADQIAALLDLGARLRQAQAQFATEDVRRLSRERHQAVVELEKEALTLARDQGPKVGNAATEELVATLEAALADEDAGEALRAGRLTTGLHYSGLGLAAIPGGTGKETEHQAGAAPAAEAPADGSPAGGTARLAEAEAALALAEREAAAARSRLEKVRQARDQCEAELADLQRRLGELRERVEAAGADVLAKEHELETIERAVISAREDVARARAGS